MQEDVSKMQHYQTSATSAINDPTVTTGGYSRTNGTLNGDHSPNSSLLSALGEDSMLTHKHHTTQQVTTVTKVVREVQHSQVTSAPELHVTSGAGSTNPSEYISPTLGTYSPITGAHAKSDQQYADYMQQGASHHIYGQRQFPHTSYPDYEHHYPNNSYVAYGGYSSVPEKPQTPPSSNEQSIAPSPLPTSLQHQGNPFNQSYIPTTGYDDLPDHYLVASAGVDLIDPYGGVIAPPAVPNTDDPSSLVYGYVPAASSYAGSMCGAISRPSAVRNPYEESESSQHHLLVSSETLAKHLTGKLVLQHDTLSPDGIGGLPPPLPPLPPLQPIAIGGGSARWRDPNLSEVIKFLSSSDNAVKANAAAYLQHLCYMDDHNKQKTRALGGIPPLVALLSHSQVDVHRNACGALRNLSYGRQNDENKRAIRNAGGIVSLVALLRRSQEPEIKELATGVIWNMSSCEDLKRDIINDSISTLVSLVIIPHSGWQVHKATSETLPSGLHLQQSNAIVQRVETCWSTVFRNASGVVRNISSAGEFARKYLRECEGLVDALLYVVRNAVDKANMGNKIVENCVCILRNLSYRCQEVEDPMYDHKTPITRSLTAGTSGDNNAYEQSVSAGDLSIRSSTQNRSASTSKGENLGCFGNSKKKKEASQQNVTKDSSVPSSQLNAPNNNGTCTISTTTVALHRIDGQSKQTNQAMKNGLVGSVERSEAVAINGGMELLWQPDVVQCYLVLLQTCSNPETLEAAAGALQNLAACYWQPSIEIRAAVRKEKGLPILVELLRMEVDRVVCAVATALRNLAIDQRNKELIGKYAMRDLVQKLPSGNPQHDQTTSDDTIAAVLATLNEVIKKNAEFSRSLLDAGGVDRLVNITARQWQRYTPRVLKFASQVLFTMWQHQELRDVYKKHGWKEQDFVTKIISSRNMSCTQLPSTSGSTSAAVAFTGSSSSAIHGPNSPINANCTLTRPMASQSGTRYEDRTMKRQQQYSTSNTTQNSTLPRSSTSSTMQATLYQGSEPLYAQVNLEKKRNRHSSVDNANQIDANHSGNLPDPNKDSWV